VLGNVIDQFGSVSSSPLGKGLYTGAALLTSSIVADELDLDTVTAMGAAKNAATNNYLSHQENKERHEAAKACKNGNDTACAKETELNALDKQRDADFHVACDGALSASLACADATRDFYAKLGTFATPEARNPAAQDKTGELTLAHKDELQSYQDLIQIANPDVKTSTESKVRAPNEYEADPYGVVDKNNTNGAYLVMKFGTEALAIANVQEGDGYAILTSTWARNGMNNPPDYATGLMMTHVDAAAELKATENKLTYTPIDRYTLSYAPTNGFAPDVGGTLMTKLGYESESVLGLRTQMEFIQNSGLQVDWVAHSRGGAEWVQAAAGSSFDTLNFNSVVFHSGANTKFAANAVMEAKDIGDVSGNKDDRYRDAPNDLVPQIVGLRFLTAPQNLLLSLVSAPCLSSTFCTIDQSPHTLPHGWNNLQQGPGK
jgi:hypothetical protein